jgi:hypothetical protein
MPGYSSRVQSPETVLMNRGFGWWRGVCVAVAVIHGVSAAGPVADLFDAPELTAAEARALVAAQGSKPGFPQRFPESWAANVESLLDVGATREQVRRLLRESDDHHHGRAWNLLSTTTSAEWRGLANRFATFLNLSAVRHLPPEVAKEVGAVRGRGSICLSGLTTLEPAAARELAKCEGTLILDGLTALTPELARELGACKGGVMLRGLPELPLDVVEACADRSAALILSGSTKIEAAALDALISQPAPLAFVSLDTLPPERARRLAAAESDLYFFGLRSLSPEAAKAFVGRNRFFMIHGLEALPEGSGDLLAEKKCELHFDRMRAISPELAAWLADDERVNLAGLRTLPVAVARELAKATGTIMLDGLEILDVDAARALAASQGTIHLGGLARLTADVAAALASGQAGLELPAVQQLDVDVVRALAAHEENLSLGIESLAPEVAVALAACRANVLELDGITTLSPTTAGGIANYESSMLSLPRLGSLDAETAARLASRRRPGGLFLGGLASLDAKAAAELARVPGSLHLDGLRTLSADVARELANTSGTLTLCGISALEPDAAAALGGKRRGSIRFRQLDPITIDVVRGLAAGSGFSLETEPDSLTPEVAELLVPVCDSQFVARFLSRLTPATATAIAALPGPVVLPNVTAVDGPEAVAVAKALARKAGALGLPQLKTIDAAALQTLVEKTDIDLPSLDALEITGSGDDVVIPETFLERQRARSATPGGR